MFILTGSARNDLIKHTQESMAGRVGIIEMPPLSQAEIRNWDTSPFSANNNKLFKKASDRSLSKDDFLKSVLIGFFPKQWKYDKPIKMFYDNYLTTYIEQDVSQIINIYEKVKFQSFIKYLASLTAHEYIPDNIAKVIDVSKNTINSWVSILVAGGIVRLLPPYYETSIHKQIVKRNKIFFNDTGLVCHLLKIDSITALNKSIHKGSIIETYIHNEIWQCYINNGLKPAMYYYRDHKQKEIDLIILHDGALDIVECKSGENYGRNDVENFKCLENTNYDINGRCIICTNDEPQNIKSGIYAFPIKCV